MDVLVSPSRDETFGMAVIEGLGSGLPVVYAQCPALTDCRIYAIGAGETFGIWGGLTEDERTPARNLTSTG